MCTWVAHWLTPFGLTTLCFGRTSHAVKLTQVSSSQNIHNSVSVLVLTLTCKSNNTNCILVGRQTLAPDAEGCTGSHMSRWAPVGSCLRGTLTTPTAALPVIRESLMAISSTCMNSSNSVPFGRHAVMAKRRQPSVAVRRHIQRDGQKAHRAYRQPSSLFGD